MSTNVPGRANPAHRDVKVREYLRIALIVRRREGDKDAAGALLYESAKQCINAAAGQRGANPGPTGSKIRFLRDLAAGATGIPDLLVNWQAASALHVNADRLHLSEPEFDTAWSAAQEFIAQMLVIYTRNE